MCKYSTEPYHANSQICAVGVFPNNISMRHHNHTGKRKCLLDASVVIII